LRYVCFNRQAFDTRFAEEAHDQLVLAFDSLANIAFLCTIHLDYQRERHLECLAMHSGRWRVYQAGFDWRGRRRSRLGHKRAATNVRLNAAATFSQLSILVLGPR
jgi:hypothetical protein